MNPTTTHSHIIEPSTAKSLESTQSPESTRPASALESKSTLDSADSLSGSALLEHFIQECLALVQTDPTAHAINQARYVLSCANMLTSEHSAELDSLLQQYQEPITIAIVGQFSSGKSTFLNALLGREILPSGITPITSKVCTISYGDEYSLIVSYRDGSRASKPLDFLHSLDELENLQITEFTLLAPIALLRHISLLDTPGFNSQNAIDTETTNAILKRVDGIIWLSLIDNVGKQSEKAILEAHIRQYASKSLCVLNQKDRLKNEHEVATSLEYARSAFSGLFSEFIPISAKLALQAQNALATADRHTSNTKAPESILAESNIQAVFDFITHELASNATTLKRHRIRHTLRALITQSRWQIHQARKALRAYKRALENFDSTIRVRALQSGLEKQFRALFLRYDSALENLAQSIFSRLEEVEFALPIKRKSLLGLQRGAESSTHRAIIIPKDTLISKLGSDESAAAKELRTLGFAISAFGQEFERFVQGELESLLRIAQELELDSRLECAGEREYHAALSAIHALGLSTSAPILAGLRSALDSLKMLITLNYPNALTLALTTLDSKIAYALQKHKQSPKDFALFTPTLENIRDSLNSALHFASFQDKLFLQNALYKKTLWELSQAYMQCAESAASLLAPLESSLESKSHTLAKYLHG